MASESVAEPAPVNKGFRLSFGLGHLLTLMAGLGLGMAIMQPWKTWERPPAPVDYDVAVVSIPMDEKIDPAILGDELYRRFGPKPTLAPGTEKVPVQFLGASSLSTIEGEAASMEVTLPSMNSNKKPDSFKIEVKPYSVRGKVSTGITPSFSWLTSTVIKEMRVTQPLGATEMRELAQTKASSDSDQEVRIFLLLTPQDATKRQFTLKPATVNAATTKP